MAAPSIQDTSFALRIAQMMHKLGIASYPRNYELVFEAYSGNNPELLRELTALGPKKTQVALDELGKRYVPHHHEHSILAHTNAQLQNQMANFLTMLEKEKTSLSEYGQVIGSASETLATMAQSGETPLAKSIEALSIATQTKATQTEYISDFVGKQAEIAKSSTLQISDFERMKFIDPLTGLGNRRAFNKALARIYSNTDIPAMVTLAVMEIDRFPNHVKLLGAGGCDALLKNTSRVLQEAAGVGEFIGRLDESRFVFVAEISDSREADRHFQSICELANSKLTITGLGGQQKEAVTLSIGYALADGCDNAITLVKYAETALATSMRTGGNKASMFALDTTRFGEGVNRLMYI